MVKNKITGYELTRTWITFRVENNYKVRSVHTDLFIYIADLYNKLSHPERFGLPTTQTCQFLGLTYNTYKRAFNELVEFGFIKVVQKAKNKHHSRIISLTLPDNSGAKGNSTVSKFDRVEDTVSNSTVSKFDRVEDTVEDTIIKPKTLNLKKESTKEKPEPEKAPTVAPEKRKPVSRSGKSFDTFLEKFNSIKGSRFRGDSKAKRSFTARIKEGFTLDEILAAVKNCKNDPYHRENPNYLTPEFILRADKLNKYLNAQSLTAKPEQEAKQPTAQEVKDMFTRRPGQLNEELHKNTLWLLGEFNRLKGANFRPTEAIKELLAARIKEGFKGPEIVKAFRTALLDNWHRDNPSILTPNFILKPDNLNKYLNAQSLTAKPEDKPKPKPLTDKEYNDYFTQRPGQ